MTQKEKTMKKIISLILAILMVVLLIPGSMFVPAFAAGTDAPTLSVEESWGEPGGTMNIYVKVKNNPGIAGAKITVNYDSNLTLTDAKGGDAFSALDFMRPGVYTSPCNFTWDSENTQVDQDGTLLVLTFQMSEDATVGEKLPVKISYRYGDIYDTQDQSLNFAVENGSVMVIDYTPGDVTGDKIVNSKDVMMLRRYIAGGYGVTINELAADVNDDGVINGKDVMRIRKYIAGGYDDIVLKPSTPKCAHELTATEAKAATATSDGNIAYWHCSKCGKYFADENAKTEITLADTVIPKATNLVIYDLNNEYIKTLGVDLEPQEYSPQTGLTLEAYNVVDGYTFDGWFDGPGSNAKQVTKIEKGTTGSVTVYAHWTEKEYSITYAVYQTPLESIDSEKYTKYTVSKGLPDLPNPTVYNYIFVGWYDENGQEVTSIPVGTTGNITLKACWTSKRNLAQPVSKPSDPIVCTDTKNGVLYFAYELGTIENVPLSEIWSVNAVSNLAQKKSETVTTTLSETRADEIVKAVSKATIDSATWTLAQDWNNVTHVNESWANERGMTVEEAETKSKTSSNTFSVTDSSGGDSTTTTTDGTTKVKYNSKNKTTETGSQFDVNADVKLKQSTEVSAKFPVKVVDVGVSRKTDVEVGLGAKYGNYDKHTTNKHTGTDTTSVDTTVTGSTSTWNNSATSSNTQTASQSQTVRQALSEVISQTKEYGKSYSVGGSNSEAQQFSSTNSESMNSSSALTYFNSQVKTTTSEYSTDGKSEGYYRLVLAGTVHVFAVVGYDVGSKSYFTYTYNVLDDKVKEFLDYCPKDSSGKFDDCENSVLPFEIPYYVYQYVTEETAVTAGVGYELNSNDGTAVITSYTGTDKDVVIPSFVSSGGVAYKVTGIAASAFSGTQIRSIMLGDYIDAIPDKAFKDCSALEEISGRFSKIGSEAFSGCTSLENFNVSGATTEIGTNAFSGVPKITVNVLDSSTAASLVKAAHPELDVENPTEDEQKQIREKIKEYAQPLTQDVVSAAVSSGAQNVVMNISSMIDGIRLDIDVPEMNSFELQGGVNGKNKDYPDLKIISKAETTVIKQVSITDSTRIPLEMSSKNVTFEAVSVESPSYALLLSADAVNLTLRKDTHITSSSGNAIVCKDPNVISEMIDGAHGTLDVSGNVYVCGSTDGIKGKSYVRVTNGEIVKISDEDFAKYIKGSYTVTLDPNGGTVEKTEITAFPGSAVGTLPTPERDYYTFNGWYTAAEDGNLVDENTVLEAAGDVTLYAHWKENAPSDWVLASEAPESAKISSEKWTYTLRQYSESASSSKSGWTKYDTKRTGWGTTQGPVYADPANGTRNVWSEQYVASTTTHYKYYHRYGWGHNTSTGTNGYVWGSDAQLGSGARHGIDLTYSLTKTSNFAGNECWKGYACPQCGEKNIWLYDGVYNVDNYATRWYYQEPVYTYYFYQDVAKEATSDPSGQANVSGVQKWVQYIAK